MKGVWSFLHICFLDYENAFELDMNHSCSTSEIGIDGKDMTPTPSGTEFEAIYYEHN